MASHIAATDNRLFTGEELAAMHDAGPCELVNGRIVPMTPTGDEHGAIEANIAAELRAYVRDRNLGKVRSGEVGIYVRRNPDTVRAADVLYISHERYARKSASVFPDVAPDLIVEILSSSDSWTEVTQKLREYFAIGVRMVWVVDPAARTIYAYRSLTGLREFTANDLLSGDEILPGFSVPVARLFEQ
ncbi:MAG TPA: Uma2 family endonuclease [Candidatus Methylomirabilis sp.]|nr:Uma2 family endonuclease [Candidatus Methylomirabilis sp.]